MGEVAVSQTPVVDARGDINVHGRAGLSIEIELDGVADISTRVLVFEVAGVIGKALETTDNAAVRRLVVTEAEVAALAVSGAQAFALLDADPSLRVRSLLWTGIWRPFGYTASPVAGVAAGVGGGAATSGSMRVVVKAAGAVRVILRNVGQDGRSAERGLYETTNPETGQPYIAAPTVAAMDERFRAPALAAAATVAAAVDGLADPGDLTLVFNNKLI